MYVQKNKGGGAVILLLTTAPPLENPDFFKASAKENNLTLQHVEELCPNQFQCVWINSQEN